MGGISFVIRALRKFSLQSTRGRQRAADRSITVLAGMSLLLAVNLVDLLPNANLVPLTYLMAGSVAGCLRSRESRKVSRRDGRAYGR